MLPIDGKGTFQQVKYSSHHFQPRKGIMIKQDKKLSYQRKMVAYAYFLPICEKHIESFRRHEDSVVHMQEGMSTEVRMIGHVLDCVHRLTDLGVCSDALVEFLVEVNFDSWSGLLQENPNFLSEKERLSLILHAYFQPVVWDKLFCERDALFAVTNKMMSYFSLLGLMNWWEVVDVSQGQASRLNSFSSFSDVIFVFLNVHADNIGFDIEEDRKDLDVLRNFIDEIMA